MHVAKVAASDCGLSEYYISVFAGVGCVCWVRPPLFRGNVHEFDQALRDVTEKVSKQHVVWGVICHERLLLRVRAHLQLYRQSVSWEWMVACMEYGTLVRRCTLHPEQHHPLKQFKLRNLG